MAKYQGHKNWNHWNVSLWINNDESLYHLARECVSQSHGRGRAAAAADMLGLLSDCGTTHTPDGAPYSKSSIRAAMVGM